MAEASILDFSTLKKNMVLGPEHHQFRLIKPVSNSPIGQVWHALDMSTGDEENEWEKVALEIVNPMLLQGRSLELFKTQVSLSKQLENKHIAHTYGYFMSREGWLFVAMEPITTRSLARILLEDGYQQLSVEKTRIILSQVAAALDYAHGKRITHGDLTPWNIIITRTGAKLVNFAFRQPLLQQIQNQGMRILNTEFHAPEAFDHLPLPATADIYSFACLAYQLFSGHPPFSPEEPLDSRDIEQLQAPDKLSQEQWEELKPALSENPGDRPASAAAIVQALFQARGPAPAEDKETEKEVTVDKPSPLSRGGGSAITLPSLQQMLVGSALFAAGAAAGYFLASSQAEQQRQQLLESVTGIQSLLAAPPTDSNSARLHDALSHFQPVAPELLKSLNRQLQNYDARLADLTAERMRPKSVMVAESPDIEEPARPETTETPNAFVPGAVFKDEIMPDTFGPNMVVLPAGKFRMGDLNRRGDDNEYPVHQVTIRRSFALSQHEVTFAEYDLFALNTGRKLPDDEGWGRGDRPVINISWNDANAYADWIRRQSGLAYRLPTEAEWEYAARAGTTTAFWWGNELEPNSAACDDCSSQFDGRRSAPVGSFQANPWGLYDMTGNVYEWVSDCYNETYEEAPTDGSSWNVGQCNYRVMRGGSWYDISRLVRSASRYRHPANSSRNSWGFRLALDLDSTGPSN